MRIELNDFQHEVFNSGIEYHRPHLFDSILFRKFRPVFDSIRDIRIRNGGRTASVVPQIGGLQMQWTLSQVLKSESEHPFSIQVNSVVCVHPPQAYKRT